MDTGCVVIWKKKNLNKKWDSYLCEAAWLNKMTIYIHLEFTKVDLFRNTAGSLKYTYTSPTIWISTPWNNYPFLRFIDPSKKLKSKISWILQKYNMNAYVPLQQDLIQTANLFYSFATTNISWKQVMSYSSFVFQFEHFMHFSAERGL